MGVQQLLLARGVPPTPPETTVYFDAMMALSPYWYLRLNDASGTSAVGQVAGRNGVYQGTGIVRGQAPLYSGGPPSTRFPAAGPRVEMARSTLPASYQEMSFVVFAKMPATFATQYNMFASHGNGNDIVDQSWQFRRDTLKLELVTIRNGSGVDVISAANMLAENVTALLGFTVRSVGGGNVEVRLYRNGVDVGGSTITAVPFGVVNEGLGINQFWQSPYYSVNDQATLSEAAFFDRALTAVEMAGLAAAAGL